MYHFQTNIHALPDTVQSADSTIIIRQHECTPLEISTEQLGQPMLVSFEQTEEMLAALDHMFIEPDGSFVWRSAPDSSTTWQVDGMLYDRADKMLYLEAKGNCPVKQFDQLLRSLGWPAGKLMFQDIAQGVYLQEEDFRQSSLQA